MRFESLVAEVKLLEPGESTGYAAASSPTAGLDRPRPGRLRRRCAAAAVGRADVLVGGLRRRIAATVSMDQLTFVIGHERDVEPGDPVR